MADETLDDLKEKRLSLGELIERALRRLHSEYHEEMELKEEEGGDHEATESNKERQAEADRAMHLLTVLYPHLDIKVKHQPAEKPKDDKSKDDEEEE